MNLARQVALQNKIRFNLDRILSWWDSGLLLLIVCAALSPIFIHGWPRTADGILHLFRLALLSDSIQNGLLYPRWMPELVLGFGYPLLHFYAPATYYVGALLQVLGLTTAQALVATFGLLTFIAGFGMRALALDIFSNQSATLRRWLALIAATAYVFAPYLLTNIYVRGAIAEMGAQAILPWIFWSFGRLVKQNKPQKYFLLSSLSLAILAITHNISLLFIPPVLILYLVVILSKGRWQRWKWVAAALVTAMGLSAFFWLPVLIERSYLAETAYQQAQGFIFDHSWTFSTMLDSALRFQYSSIPPFRLGLVQIVLALAGFILSRRTDREWIFWLVLALICGFAISRLAVPVWQGNQILLIAQFPWRLLTLITPALALLTAGLLLSMQKQSARIIGITAVMIISVILLANWPSYSWSQSLNPTDISVNTATLAQFEKEIGALGTSSSNEFLPRWVENLDFENTTVLDPSTNSITLLEATPTEMKFRVTNEGLTTLRWTNFYFPGWRVTMEDGTVLPTFATTPAGLLSVDVPAGTHQLTLSLVGTTWQYVATAISLITAVIVLAFVGHELTNRPWWIFPALFIFLAGLIVVFPKTASSTLTKPTNSDQSAPIQLLGYKAEQNDSFLEINPYWYVRQPVSSLQVLWQLKDQNGTQITSIYSSPYYAVADNIDWPTGTIVDDAYLLPLPPGLSAGTYRLEMAMSDDTSPIFVGELTLSETPISDQPPLPNSPIIYGEEIVFTDYVLELNGQPMMNQTILTVQPGDHMQYTLHWQALQQPQANYRGAFHLTDENWQTLTQRDHHLGQFYNYPRLWHPDLIQKDIYRIEIPSNATSGIYWPRLGVYDLNANGDIVSLEAKDRNGSSLGTVHTLPPIKVLNNPDPVGTEEMDLKIAEIGKLIGYDLNTPDTITAGATISITFSYLSNGTSPINYSRFIHLHNPEAGLIAQADGAPQNGINPTSVWVADEIINDQVLLTIPDNTLPGTYQLYIGFYNPIDGVRLPIFNEDEQPLQNNQILIGEILIR